ncbi:LRR domain containing protein, partial [Trema orientale]
CMPLFPSLDNELILMNTSWKPFMQTVLNVTSHKMTRDEASSSSASSDSLPLSKLMYLNIMDNKDIESLPDWLSTLSSLKILTLEDCPNLKTLSPGIQHFTSLRELRIFNCQELDLSHGDVWRALRSLQILKLRALPQLVDLPMEIQQLNTLQYVQVEKCENLDLSTRTSLQIRVV